MYSVTISQAYPQEIIPIMDIVANEQFTTLFGDTHQQKIQGTCRINSKYNCFKFAIVAV